MKKVRPIHSFKHMTDLNGQLWMAVALNVSQATISRWYTGKNEPTVTHREDIERVLHINSMEEWS